MKRHVFVKDEIRNLIIEECAIAAEAQDRSGYEWVPDSLWANILRRAGANVRKLKSAAPSVSHPSQHGGTKREEH